MPVTIKRNRVPATLEVTGLRKRYKERINVNGISVTAGQEQEALFSILSATGMPAQGSTLEGHPEFILSSIQIESAGVEDAIGYLNWEVDLAGAGATPSVSIFSESTTLLAKTRDTLPGTRQPFRTGPALVGPTLQEIAEAVIAGVPGIGNSSVASGNTYGAFIPLPEVFPPDNVAFNILTPHRVVTVSSLTYGEIPTGAGNKVGKVNDADWRDLGKAFWLLTEYTIGISKYSGYFQTKVSALSKVSEDWRDMGILRSRDTGQHLKIPQEIVDEAINGEYEFGVHPFMGGVVVCPYETTDFTQIFVS